MRDFNLIMACEISTHIWYISLNFNAYMDGGILCFFWLKQVFLFAIKTRLSLDNIKIKAYNIFIYYIIAKL